MRPDDILVCGYAKTGCHWIWETVNMIVKRRAEHTNYLKVIAFLEMAAPELYDALPSPRILNTHNEYEELPDQAKAMKTKIVLTTRNPKDTAVSLYNHHINLKEVYNYEGEFSDWFQFFLNGTVDNGNYFDYHLAWEKAMNEHPDHPILVVKYEEMKQDTQAGIRRIANFLEVPLTDDQVAKIATAAGFGSMKKKFQNQPTEKLIRKGEVGDWRNWLTEEQAKKLDNLSKQFLTGTRFEPIDRI
ncbi:unnamed protein product [Candidula unifasciata]|uniref:Sulfotransferase domain-containing protein n=1 Tax=Candidula unifasciata TaxID=100452 RepID=A0A8S3Z2Z7_9EUPU|nr:unnamed protein product [Candidula unifasciata]